MSVDDGCWLGKPYYFPSISIPLGNDERVNKSTCRCRYPSYHGDTIAQGVGWGFTVRLTDEEVEAEAAQSDGSPRRIQEAYRTCQPSHDLGEEGSAPLCQRSLSTSRHLTRLRRML